MEQEISCEKATRRPKFSTESRRKLKTRRSQSSVGITSELDSNNAPNEECNNTSLIDLKKKEARELR